VNLPVFAIAAAALTSACVTSAEDAPPTGTVEQAAAGCSIWDCNSNSPVIDALPAHEFNLNPAVVSPEGWKLLQFRKAGVPYTPLVRAGRLSGTSNGVTIAGPSLLGASFLVQQTSGARFILAITGVNSSNAYWAQLPPPATQPVFESYRFEWTPTDDGVNSANGRWANLCSKANADLVGEGILGEHALLFEGDRIVAASKTFSSTDTTIDTRWFNIGCAGHALAKLHLTGHTYAAGLQGFRTNTSQRQTMLKMFTADYCGHGYPFTVAGQKLQWKDEHGWMDYETGATVYLEARWTPSGAACIGRARVDENPTSDAWDVFRQNGATVYWTWLNDKTMCPVRPPDCTDFDPRALDGYHVVSATPPP
jgi:hypothetical protein